MLDQDGKKIFYSDEENNFDLPLELIQDIYDKNEAGIVLNSREDIEDHDEVKEENFINEAFEDHEDDKEENFINETFEDHEEVKEENIEDHEEEIDLSNENKYDSYYLERIDEVEDLLDEICESIPAYAFEHLNGGIILTEDIKYHEESYADDLLIMGEYQRSILGNMIKIYYGSFMEMYRFSSRDRLREKLEEVLLHEFTHHLEFLANEWGLVIEDKKFLEEYRKGKNNE